VAATVLHNFALMHQEQDMKMKMFHFTLLPQQTQVAMPNASSLFRDTLLHKINDLMKLHVGFIDNKIGNSREHSPQLINLFILLF